MVLRLTYRRRTPPKPPRRSRGILRGCGGLALVSACWQLSAAAPAWAAASAPPSPSSLAGQRRQAELTLRQGDWRRGCPQLRRVIDGTGALYARSPSPALQSDLRALVQALQPCIRKGF